MTVKVQTSICPFCNIQIPINGDRTICLGHGVYADYDRMIQVLGKKGFPKAGIKLPTKNGSVVNLSNWLNYALHRCQEKEDARKLTQKVYEISEITNISLI